MRKKLQESSIILEKGKRFLRDVFGKTSDHGKGAASCSEKKGGGASSMNGTRFEARGLPVAQHVKRKRKKKKRKTKRKRRKKERKKKKGKKEKKEEKREKKKKNERREGGGEGGSVDQERLDLKKKIVISAVKLRRERKGRKTDRV